MSKYHLINNILNIKYIAMVLPKNRLGSSSKDSSKQRKAMPKKRSNAQEERAQQKNKLSKFIKKAPKSLQTKRENTYVFTGFHERLKQIDVKHGHSLAANNIFDRLLEEKDFQTGEEGEQEIFKSNFIQLLRSEKANNKTIEFGKVFSDCEPFCFSYPLLVHNKGRVIEKLLLHLKGGNQQSNRDSAVVASHRLVQAGVIELFVALIKDFRQDIYEEFLMQIMPAIIATLDIANTDIMDKAFTLLSFAVKYLTKPIKEDIERFYNTYSEMLSHQNKYIRKFAAQAFCYVLRKLPFHDKLISIILEPLNNTSANKKRMLEQATGISDLIFEVAYGAGETLHSKASEVLQQVLRYKVSGQRTPEQCIFIRSLLLKLINEVDTEKHKAIYDTLIGNLSTSVEDDLKLTLDFFKDIIKLKFGRRVSQYGMVIITDFFNKLLKHQSIQGIPKDLHPQIASTMGLLYYYKHQQVLSLFQKSQIDFSNSKHLLNHSIYNLALASENCLPVIEAFFSLMIGSNIDATEEGTTQDIDWNKILGLKQSANNQVEFTNESHRQKIMMLIKSYNMFLLKQMSNGNESTIIDLIAIFEMLAQQTQDTIVVEVKNEELETKVVSLLKCIQKSGSQEQLFTLYKFVSRCKCSEHGQLIKYLQQDFYQKPSGIDRKDIAQLLSKQISDNFVLRNYNLTEENAKNMEQVIYQTIDLVNQGDTNQICSQIQALKQIFINRHSQATSAISQTLIKLLLENPSDIVVLRAFNAIAPTNKDTLLNISRDQTALELFKKLSINLSQNQRILKLETLKALNNHFEMLDIKGSASDVSVKSDILKLMLTFEQFDISFLNEKAKILQIERLKSHIEGDSVPELYLQTCFHFLVGIFWTKFTPLFPQTQATLQVLVGEYGFTEQLMNLVENYGYLTQLAHENQQLEEILLFKKNMNPSVQQTLVQKSHRQETSLNEDYMEIKDFLYNLVKSFSISQLLSNEHRQAFFSKIFYRFIDCEYTLLYFSKSNTAAQDILDTMTYANMVDSEDFKQHRRHAYSKLYCMLELLQQAESLKQIPNLAAFQNLLLKLLNTSDTKLQKITLDCLLKSDANGTFKHYRRLLEGFTDDLRFKDMIQVVNFGSQAGNTNQTSEQETEAATQDKKGGNIPKLADKHRLEVLPVIIKLLLSKLLKKKGAINQKTVHVRRTIVFQFMSQLNPEKGELRLFLNELLSCFPCLDIENAEIFNNETKLQTLISQTSFSKYLSFLGDLQVIVKQMGSLLVYNGYLQRITSVIVYLLALAKRFLKHLKLSLADDNNKDSDSENENDLDMHDEEQPPSGNIAANEKESLYRYVGHQSKICLRKGLGMIKQLYSKYSHLPDYLSQFSSQVFTEIICDQLPLLPTMFISDRSQLLEILTLSWTQSPHLINNYITYPQVMPALLSMLTESKIQPEVYEIILQMLKTLIMKSIQGEEDKKDLAFLYKRSGNEDDQPMMTEEEQQHQALERDLSKQILSLYTGEIASSLNIFCQNNLAELKKTLITRNKKKPVVGAQYKPTTHEIKNQTIKDLIIVMSEMAHYLQKGDPLNSSLMDMILSVISMKNVHVAAAGQGFFEELLHFGCKSINNLLAKLNSLEEKVIDKMFQLFLQFKSLRIRQAFSVDLQSSLPNATSLVRSEVLQTIANLNKLKRGAADLELDYDLVIKTVQGLIESKLQLSQLELQAISYSILSLLQNEEFSVRDFASHFIKQSLLENCLKEQPNLQLTQLIEQILIANIQRVSDEMVLKTMLDTLRHFIAFLKASHQQEGQYQSQLSALAPLVNLKDDNDDFFASFTAIKMKSRQKSLKMISAKMTQINNYKAVQQVIMPLVNYLIFGDQAQKQNRRNTISYNKEEKRALIEEALNVYQAIASSLKWSDYYRLLKSLTFKLARLTSNASLAVTENYHDEELAGQEKIVTKCICRVLNGFHFEGIPDAQEELLKMGDQAVLEDKEQQLLGNELEEVYKIVNPEREDEEDDEDSEDIVIKKDVEMVEHHGNDEGIKEIQQKLFQKILPILERHLTDAPVASQEDPPVIRTFVVVSIVKLLRKLPMATFKSQLEKLVTTIVSKGLRQRDIACRDKGRKALLNILIEVSPRSPFLSMVFQEMKDQLQKGGYQLHTFVYTVHHLMQQLHERKLLVAGDVSTFIVELIAEKFLEELFNSNQGADATLEDKEKARIKENKTKKAIPTFEMFAQYIDFKASFFALIAPVVKTLEENPTISKIQQCEDLLNRLSTSLLRNTSIKSEELLMFMYTVIQRGISQAVKVRPNDDKGVQRDYGERKKDIFIKTKEEYKEQTYSVAMSWKKTSQQLTDKKTQEICGRVLGSFGLQCLKRALKTSSLVMTSSSPETEEINPADVKEEMKAQLDPFVGVLLDAFKTYHNPIIVTTLHVLGQLIPLGLPSFKDLMKKFLSKIFKLFATTSSSADSDFLNSLFRCTAEQIRTYATYQDLTPAQVKTLVGIVKQHINSVSTQSNVFHLLRAIVYRKFICADLYDLIESVQDLMITSIAKSTRTVCAAIFTQFLLEYPLESERVEQHLNHLLKNLGYFDSEGRMQLLEVIGSLIERFPKELTDQYSELIFFTLLLRTVNESNTKCRERVIQVAKRLIQKTSQNKAKTLFNTVLQMSYGDDKSKQKKQQLLHAKHLILSVFIEAYGYQLKAPEAEKIFDQCLHTIQEEALSIVEEQNTLKKQKEEESEDEDDGYDTLQNPEMKGFLKNIELMDQDTEKQAIIKNPTFTIDFEEERHEAEWGPLYQALINIEKLYSANGEKYGTQIGSILVSNHSGQSNLIPNILIIILHHKCYWIRLAVSRIFGAIFSLQMQNDIDIANALEQNDSKDIVNILYKLANVFKFKPVLSEDLGIQQVKNLTFLLKTAMKEAPEHLSLQKLFSRLSFLARKMMLNVTEAKDRIANILLFFQVAFSLFESQIVQDHEEQQNRDNKQAREVLTPVLELVYRVYTDDQYKDTRAKELAFELVDYLSTGIDKTFFINAYNQVKQGIHTKRLERKRQQKIALAGAEGAKIREKRRLRKAEKKKEKSRAKKLHYELRKN